MNILTYNTKPEKVIGRFGVVYMAENFFSKGAWYTAEIVSPTGLWMEGSEPHSTKEAAIAAARRLSSRLDGTSNKYKE